MVILNNYFLRINSIIFACLPFCCMSCISIGDDWQTVETDATQNKCISIKSKVNVTAILDDIQESGTEVHFDIEDENVDEVSLHIFKSGYIPQDIKVGLRYHRIAGLEALLVQEPTVKVEQEDAVSGISITNDEANQNETGVKASVTLTEGTKTLLEYSSPFSLSVFTPTMIIDKKMESGDIISVPVFSFILFPQDVIFDKPVTMRLDIGELKQCDLELYNEGKSVPFHMEGNIIVAELTSISNCTLNIKAEVVASEEGIEETSGSMNAYYGDNFISYVDKIGYDDFSSDLSLVKLFLKNVFGTSAITLVRNANYKTTTSSRIDYMIAQHYCNYTFKSGETLFTAKMNYPDSVSVRSMFVDKSDLDYGGTGESTGL